MNLICVQLPVGESQMYIVEWLRNLSLLHKSWNKSSLNELYLMNKGRRRNMYDANYTDLKAVQIITNFSSEIVDKSLWEYSEFSTI
jgi:hypothetical protein